MLDAAASVGSMLLPTTFGGVLGTGLLTLFIASLIAGSDAGNMSKGFAWQFRLAAALRTPVLVFVVVPMSFTMWCFRTLKLKWRGAPIDIDPVSHAARVQEVVDQVKDWDAAGRKQKMRTARPNWAAMSLKLGSNKAENCRIRTHHLDQILCLDEEALTLRCEPAVTMGDITSLLMPKGYALLLQIEMEAITIGGLSMGLGMETNSHNVGWFQETVVAFEIVTAQSPPQAAPSAAAPAHVASRLPPASAAGRLRLPRTSTRALPPARLHPRASLRRSRQPGKPGGEPTPSHRPPPVLAHSCRW